jgi:hypothetical protein
MAKETLYEYRFRQDGRHHLGPDMEDVGPWERKGLLKPRHDGQNQIGLNVGSPVKTWVHTCDLVREQGLEGTALRVIAGGSPTDSDLGGFQQHEAEWEEIRSGLRYGYHHPKILTDVKKIGDRGGYGANPLRAVEDLEVNPSVSDALDEVVAKAARVLRDDSNVNAVVTLLKGYGGCYPLQEHTLFILGSAIPIKRTDTFHLVPPKREPLHRRNARGELALVLENPAVPERLDAFVLQASTGPQPSDPALMAGILAITGDGGVHCSFDSETIHSLLEMSGDYVVARPCTVPVPIKRFGTGWGWFRREHNDEYNSPVRILVTEVRELVRDTRDDFHLVTIEGMFTDDQVGQLKRQCEALGNVHVRVNLMRPWLSSDKRMANFLVCDFSTPRYVPWELVGLFDPLASDYYRHGLTWDHLRDLAANVPEKQAGALRVSYKGSVPCPLLALCL